MGRWVIVNWMGEEIFPGQTFCSFEDAWAFVYERFPEDDWQDIYVDEK